MKKICEFNVILVLAIVISVTASGLFLNNIYKLATDCDFSPNYKCEILRGAGIIIPPLGIVMGLVGDLDNG